ncbi:uncharacterized protein YjlB [Tepidamorphus gemmatus]|jgi:uncharacterized protein YjlB|uniref:Uncharacterized protein YjlB n=1 Tax=Tepidamorphus gemmatus TaxID=747076 RepID=A0A4V2V032_9HYPH|nr:cupin domain-containing protein [Tepidamorphus gemmatus]TCT13699.1 uncharacterized protein YjlB [Tepidamorphus gemmatus]
MAVEDFVIVPPITAVHLAEGRDIPNSRLPALIYHAAIEPRVATAEAFEALFRRNGWEPAWRAGIYPFHHYHSTAHEVLGVASGRARVLLGGTHGRAFDIAAGDALVLPAGVGHKLIEASGNFLVVGAYPPGQHWDLKRGEPGERPAADHNIASVARPDCDPVQGPNGPLAELWR